MASLLTRPHPGSVAGDEGRACGVRDLGAAEAERLELFAVVQPAAAACMQAAAAAPGRPVEEDL